MKTEADSFIEQWKIEPGHFQVISESQECLNMTVLKQLFFQIGGIKELGLGVTMDK